MFSGPASPLRLKRYLNSSFNRPVRVPTAAPRLMKQPSRDDHGDDNEYKRKVASWHVGSFHQPGKDNAKLIDIIMETIAKAKVLVESSHIRGLKRELGNFPV